MLGSWCSYAVHSRVLENYICVHLCDMMYEYKYGTVISVVHTTSTVQCRLADCCM